jgi:hypothetical protein
MPRRHTLTITIECRDAQTEHQAQNLLHSWIETNGHAEGFEFLFVGVLPRQPSKKKVTPKDRERLLPLPK